MNEQTTNNQQPSTKKEDYDLNKQKKQSAQAAQFRGKKIKKVLPIVLSVLLLGGLVTFIVVKSAKNSNGSSSGSSNGSSQETQTGTPKIEINPQKFDAGNLPINGGVFKKDFEVKNAGTGDLKINSISTSCHCTSAVLKIGDKTSPKFGMDGSGFWSGNIPAGQTAQLEVIFDPAFHGPAGIGAATRVVYLGTNDPQNKKAQVELDANVTP